MFLISPLRTIIKFKIYPNARTSTFFCESNWYFFMKIYVVDRLKNGHKIGTVSYLLREINWAFFGSYREFPRHELATL